MEGFTYLSPFISQPELQKFAAGAVLGGALIAVGMKAAASIKRAEGVQEAVVPSAKPSISSIFDLLVEMYLKYFDSILGRERREFAPFCGSVFFFVLAANMLGLIPGMPAITTTIWVNVGMALVVFISFNWIGVRENGVIGYLKHFCGPVIFVAPLMFPLEILSTCLRILTLTMRLYWNISADHLVLATFTDLANYVVPVAFYAMGTFVAFMQAFVFGTLTMIYILLVMQHEEDEHH